MYRLSLLVDRNSQMGLYNLEMGHTQFVSLIHKELSLIIDDNTQIQSWARGAIIP